MSARARASRSTDGGRLAPGVLSDPDMVGRGYGGSHLDAPAVATPSMTTVLGFLVVAFLAVPIVEIYLIVEVARYAGMLNTVALLVLVSVAGAWMVRREGLGILRRARDELAVGRVPGRQMVDGLLVLVAGALMLTPGFATDALGLALLFPPSRIAVREVLIRRFARRVNLG